jgi:hypothetical protein
MADEDSDIPPLPKGAVWKSANELTTLPPLPKGAVWKNVNELPPLPRGARWETLPQEAKKESAWDRAKKIGEEALAGGAIGAASPWILSGLGMAASAFPPTAPLGPPLMMMGQAARGARLAAEIGLGALSGAGGETAAQLAEMAGKGGGVQEAARLAGGVAAPSAPGAVKGLLRGALHSIGLAHPIDAIVAAAKGKSVAELTPRQFGMIRGVTKEFQPEQVSPRAKDLNEYINRYQGRAPLLPTNLGNAMRNTAMRTFNRYKAIRAANAEANKAEAFGTALMKEKAGQSIKNTTAYMSALKEIDNEIKNPETGFANVPISEVRNQLLKVRSALEQDPPISFEGLENLRRFLRERADGLPAEGFDAIGQQQAGRLADAVERIQTEFSPGMKEFLEKYRADSEPLRNFKVKLGKAIVGVEDFDMGQMEHFKVNPSKIGDQVFTDRTNVNYFIEMLGGDKDAKATAERFARRYVASKLADSSSPEEVWKDVRKWKDWLPAFPGLRSEMATIIKQEFAKQAMNSPKTALDQWNYIRRTITSIRGMSPEEITKLDKQVDRIKQIADPTFKAKAMQMFGRALYFAGVTEASRAPVAVTQQ